MVYTTSVTGSEVKLTMVLEMAGEKDVERITVSFKSIGKWETKESSISVVEKAIIKECSKKFWMLSKEDQFRLKTGSSKKWKYTVNSLMAWITVLGSFLWKQLYLLFA